MSQLSGSNKSDLEHPYISEEQDAENYAIFIHSVKPNANTNANTLFVSKYIPDLLKLSDDGYSSLLLSKLTSSHVTISDDEISEITSTINEILDALPDEFIYISKLLPVLELIAILLLIPTLVFSMVVYYFLRFYFELKIYTDTKNKLKNTYIPRIENYLREKNAKLNLLGLHWKVEMKEFLTEISLDGMRVYKPGIELALINNNI